MRQELGRVLLAARRPTQAARVFQKDLERFPKNTWSLEGLRLARRDGAALAGR